MLHFVLCATLSGRIVVVLDLVSYTTSFASHVVWNS